MRIFIFKSLFVSQFLIHTAAVAQEWDGPFGVQMGLTEEQLRTKIPDLTRVTDFSFVFRAAPKQYPGANYYVAQISTKSGLCSISAHSLVKSSAFGDAVRNKFESIYNHLAGKYGPPTSTFDFIPSESLWTNPEHWMMGLSRGDRILASFWSKPESSGAETKLPVTLNAISVEATSERVDAADVAISYEFANFDACVEDVEKLRADIL